MRLSVILFHDCAARMSFEDWLANFHMLQLCHLPPKQHLAVCISRCLYIYLSAYLIICLFSLCVHLVVMCILLMQCCAKHLIETRSVLTVGCA